jgi:predicted nicotinamide N-methyase
MSLLPIFMKEFEIGSVTVKIEQEGQVGIGGMVWDASLILAKFIAQNKLEIFSRVKTVLEVGSGTGICGLACAMLEPKTRVTLSDLYSHLALIQTNIDINNLSNVSCCEIDWFKPQNTGKFDLIIGTDVVYEPDLFEPLLDTLETVSHPNSVIFLCNELRATRDLNFYKLAQKKGWTLTIVPEHLQDKEYFSHECPVMRFTRTR